MNSYKVKVVTYYPATVVEELVEVEAMNLEQAKQWALEGDGFLLSETVDFGDEGETFVLEVPNL